MIHDNDMPHGWHAIKSVLITEIATAGTFHLCMKAADALFHARLIGEGIAGEVKMKEGRRREGNLNPASACNEQLRP